MPTSEKKYTEIYLNELKLLQKICCQEKAKKDINAKTYIQCFLVLKKHLIPAQSNNISIGTKKPAMHIYRCKNNKKDANKCL